MSKINQNSVAEKSCKIALPYGNLHGLMKTRVIAVLFVSLRRKSREFDGIAWIGLCIYAQNVCTKFE